MQAMQRRVELTIRADSWDARRASEWLASVARAQSVPAEHIVRLDHCLDEALANVITHGGPAALASPIRLQFDLRRSEGTCTAALSIVDEGIAFDPSCSLVEATQRPATLAEASVGGLGILLIRNFSDDLSYRHSEGRNHLTISVVWREAA